MDCFSFVRVTQYNKKHFTIQELSKKSFQYLSPLLKVDRGAMVLKCSPQRLHMLISKVLRTNLNIFRLKLIVLENWKKYLYKSFYSDYKTHKEFSIRNKVISLDQQIRKWFFIMIFEMKSAKIYISISLNEHWIYSNNRLITFVWIVF